MAEELKPCPFCGGSAKTHGSNMVVCENFYCGAQIDFGHWTGHAEDGTPAIAFVIRAWNTRKEQ